MLDRLPEEFRSALFLDCPHPIAVIDNSYMMKETNKAWAGMTGWTESEVADALSLVDLVEMQRDKEALKGKIIKMVELGREYDRIETVVRTKLGDLRKTSLRFLSVLDESTGKRRFEYAVIWAKDLGPYETASKEPSRLRRLWAYIVVLTGVLWLSDFSKLVDIFWSSMPGFGE